MPQPMFVEAYYRTDKGEYEKTLMYRTDYLEAAAGKESDRWSLEPPKKGAPVVDRTPASPATEAPLPSPPPAAVERPAEAKAAAPAAPAK